MTDVFTHPWLGSLFGDDEVNTVLSADRQLHNMLAVEGAYTAALCSDGRVSDAAADAVAEALANPKIDMDALRDGAAQDGLAVPALIRQLKAQVAAEHHAALHSGLTSQDVIDTAFALSMKQLLPKFQRQLTVLDAGLTALAKQHEAKPLMGRTRMQAAMPITVSDRVATWRAPLVSHAARLAALQPDVVLLSIGGPVGTRENDAIARHMADKLGLTLPDKAPHVMRGNLADLANALSLITGSLGKMGQDITLMAQQGIDEVKLSTGGKSSAMAHKNNPIKAELLVTLARFNATLLPGMHQAMVHEQERSGAAWGLEWMLLPQMLRATGAALRNATQLVDEIEDIGSNRFA